MSISNNSKAPSSYSLLSKAAPFASKFAYNANYVNIVPEPAPKRKTLVERAGEINTAATATGRYAAGVTPHSATSQNRNGLPASSNTAATSVSKLPSTLSSSMSSRYASTSSLNSSTSSMQRPMTAYGHHRSQTAIGQHGRYKSQNGGRPATAMDSRRVAVSADDGRTGAGEAVEKQKQKGMVEAFPLTSNPLPKTSFYVHAGQQQQSSQDTNMRDQCFVSAWSNSTVADSASTHIFPRLQKAPDSERDTRRVSSLSAALERLTLESRSVDHATSKSIAALSDAQSPSSSFPKTFSYLPKLVPKAPQTPNYVHNSVTQNHVKARTPYRTPQRNVFLTKDSNTKVPAWDADERLENMNGLLNKFMENVNNSMSTGQKLDEIQSVYKSRSMSNTDLYITPAQFLSDFKNVPRHY